MIIKNIEFTLLKIDKREGVGRASGKDYLFYNATLIDDESNVFGFIVNEKIIKETEKLADLLSAKNQPVKCDIRLFPKGFAISGSVVGIEIV